MFKKKSSPWVRENLKCFIKSTIDAISLSVNFKLQGKHQNIQNK